jgi:hypothetical protein
VTLAASLTADEIAALESLGDTMSYVQHIVPYGRWRVIDAVLDGRFTPDTEARLRERFAALAFDMRSLERKVDAMDVKLEQLLDMVSAIR